MNKKLYVIMNVIRFIANNARIKVYRSKSDFLADRIVQAGTESTLLAFVDRLAKLMDADLGELYTSSEIEFIRVVGEPEAVSILQWIRNYPRIATMIATLPKNEQVIEACDLIIVETGAEKTGVALLQETFDIDIKMTALAPISHGADTKAGNATLFRRMQILSTTGSVLNLPFYSGNAFRGEMRDCLADHFLQAIGITHSRSKPEIALWFFHALYAGGSLEEDSKAAKALSQLGANGAIKSEGIYKFRDTLPALSLLGCALGNRIIAGRVKFADYRPECMEWGNGTIPAGELMEWLYLTRREDFEGRDEFDKNTSMIANSECLKAGVILRGGVDIDFHHSELEKSALGCGLSLLMNKGYIGAESRRGFGKVKIEVDNLPDSKLYEEFLKEKKDDILKYLIGLEVIKCTPST